MHDPMTVEVIWMSSLFFAIVLTLVGSVLLLEKHG
ncbi:small membrane protein YoaI [Siccibacter turicensis]|nr:small membrane protein YoaI [Siccibacter turicensis]MDY0971055.1 small membrane protein YoaI [Siccibacter turicensis]